MPAVGKNYVAPPPVWTGEASRKTPVHVRADLGVRIRESDARFITFHGLGTSDEHFALILGPKTNRTAPLVRIHTECGPGDPTGSTGCNCNYRFNDAVDRCQAEGGILLYLRHKDHDILAASAMMKALGIKRIRLMTNSPQKAEAFKRAGIQVQEIVPLLAHTTNDGGVLEANIGHAHQQEQLTLSRAT
jgi:GTP cyclohydrolase II